MPILVFMTPRKKSNLRRGFNRVLPPKGHVKAGCPLSRAFEKKRRTVGQPKKVEIK